MRPADGHAEDGDQVQAAATSPPHRAYAAVHPAGPRHLDIADEPPTLGQRPGDVWNVAEARRSTRRAGQVPVSRSCFRWIGLGRTVLGTAISGQPPACLQPELRPDLLVSSISVAPDQRRPGRRRYTAVIANRGATGAGPFEVGSRRPRIGHRRRATVAVDRRAHASTLLAVRRAALHDARRPRRSRSIRAERSTIQPRRQRARRPTCPRRRLAGADAATAACGPLDSIGR